MTSSTVTPFARKIVLSNPALMTVATAASGIIRQLAIKPFAPRLRRREILCRERLPSIHAVHNRIYKEKGSGDLPTIVVGGFVPDATEAVEFQRELFRRYGSIYYLNYARSGFSTELLLAQLGDLVEDLNRRGKKPVIFAISFGCSLVARFLRTVAADDRLAIRGVVMTSPVLSTDDLVRPDRQKGDGVRMLESNLRRILRAGAEKGEELERQIERARRCFQALFEAGAENRPLSSRHLSIRKRIMEVLERTSCRGGYERVLALKEAAPAPGAPLFDGPTLVMLAEEEDNLLVPGSPTLELLRDQATSRRLFPRGTVRTVASAVRGDAVPHASLIFHHHCYNPFIESWYDKLNGVLRFAVVS